MILVGMNFSTNASGVKTTTLHVNDDFNAYYINAEAGRGCIGKKTDSIYVGDFDCSALKVGMEIEVMYEKAITTKRGTFQPVKRIDILK
ncbi:TPA: hypothetical protein LA827_002780 [Clostridium botulinum]|nr:hypothetical protein [Clostridium botulinum]